MPISGRQQLGAQPAACGAAARCTVKRSNATGAPVHRFTRNNVCASAEKDVEAAPDVGWLWDTRAALRSIKARPKKALGQNFISDSNIIQRIVKQGAVTEGDIVIEIGPGTGNLTQHLLEAGATVLAVEKDYAFAERLEVELGSNPKCKILQGDILRLNIEELISSVKEKHGWAADDPKRVRIVANLPYYITTELLKQLLPLGDKIESLLLLLQDEVAQRLTTEHPDGAAYRPMTVLTHYFAEPKYHFKIDRSCFFPVPSVHGAVVTFKLLPSAERATVQNEREFTMFVRQAFLSKRKMLANSLMPKWQRETVNTALETLGFSSTVRPADISSKKYVDVYNAVCEVEAQQVASQISTSDAKTQQL